jgi:ABC-type transport system involved in multi-copper enzyme maturation permease subunit
MKGLLLKDIISLRKQGLVILAMAGFYTLFSIFAKDTGMLGAMVALIGAMLPITTMSYDELSKWDRYALSMPIQRKSVVISKYLLGVMMNLASSVMVIIINFVLMLFVDIKIGDMLIAAYAACMITILLIVFILPILFKFGVEKGRILMLAVVAVPFMIALLLSRLGVQMPDESFLKMLAYAAPLIVACVLLISLNISIGIYSKKEF